MPDIATIRVKALDPEQGDFVVINLADLDPLTQELYEPAVHVVPGVAAAPGAKARRVRATPSNTIGA